MQGLSLQPEKVWSLYSLWVPPLLAEYQLWVWRNLGQILTGLWVWFLWRPVSSNEQKTFLHKLPCLTSSWTMPLKHVINPEKTQSENVNSPYKRAQSRCFWQRASRTISKPRIFTQAQRSAGGGEAWGGDSGRHLVWLSGCHTAVWSPLLSER